MLISRISDSEQGTRALRHKNDGNCGGKRFILEDFQYLKETDEYVCPNGKVLRSRRKRMIVNDVIYKRYLANREDCTSCPLKNRCIKGNLIKGRYLDVPIEATPGNLIKEMAEKADTERGGASITRE
jgi:hypothetical protein